MDNNFSDGHHNIENEKDDEENRGPSSVYIDSFPIKEQIEDKEPIDNAQSHIEKEENVAENVEGVNYIEDGNGFHFKQGQDKDNNILGIDSESLTSDASDTSTHDDDDEIREEESINRPQHPMLEPSTPEDLVDDWERLNHTRLPKNLRKFAIKVAAIHLDEDGDGRGVTVKDIRILFGCETIYAAKARRDRAVEMGLLVPHPTLKDGKQKMYFLSNYIHVVNERLERRLKETPVSPLDIALALIKVLSFRKCAYHHISLRTNLKYPEEDYDRLDTASNWVIKSPKNNTKTATYKLEDRRNCTLNISKNGTVMISIECSKDQYKLHTDEGIAELFVSCGQILSILQQEARNRLNVVASSN